MGEPIVDVSDYLGFAIDALPNETRGFNCMIDTTVICRFDFRFFLQGLGSGFPAYDVCQVWK